MKKKYPGNRRTAVPADRHKRAVAYRHIRYAVSRTEDQKLAEEEKKKKSFFITADQNDTVPDSGETTGINETLSIPKIEREDVSPEPQHEKPERKKSHSQKKKTKKVQEPEERPVRRRDRKKMEREEELEELLDEPTNSIAEILTDPAGCMDRVEKVDHATLSMGNCIVQMILKWLLIGFGIALFTAKFINQNPFGFADLSFTEIAQFAAKLGGYGFVAELVNYLITGMICSTLRKPLDKRRMISIDTYGIPCGVVLLIISCILMEFNTLIGAALFITACILMLFLKEYALTKADVSTRRHMLSVFICTLLFIVCGYFFIKASCGNIWAILEDIMNI